MVTAPLLTFRFVVLLPKSRILLLYTQNRRAAIPAKVKKSGLRTCLDPFQLCFALDRFPSSVPHAKETWGKKKKNSMIDLLQYYPVLSASNTANTLLVFAEDPCYPGPVQCCFAPCSQTVQHMQQSSTQMSLHIIIPREKERWGGMK